jgi:hypothetical protein
MRIGKRRAVNLMAFLGRSRSQATPVIDPPSVFAWEVNTDSDIITKTISSDKKRVKIPTSDSELMACFESIGDNCEFGIAQRLAGVERIYLFRFNTINIPNLIEGLETKFERLKNPNDVVAKFANNEWLISERNYGFDYHTFDDDQTKSTEDVAQEQFRWMRFMADKFIEWLTPNRIYVRKGGGPQDEEQVRDLVRALRKHGDITVLWVCKAERPEQIEQVEWLDEGLLRGWIRDFAPYGLVVALTSLANWLPICRKTWAMRHNAESKHAPRSHPGMLNFAGWSGSPNAVSENMWNLVAPEAHAVMRHTLITEAEKGVEVYGCLQDVTPQTGNFVASALIYLPHDAAISAGGLILLGHASLGLRTIDIQRKNVWQRIWVSANVDKTAFARLNLCGSKDAFIYSADWRLEPGTFPSALI